MFKLAVVGPIVTAGLGVARECFECYRWDPSYGGIRCYGFGAGCIEFRPRSREGTDSKCRDAGLGLARQ